MLFFAAGSISEMQLRALYLLFIHPHLNNPINASFVSHCFFMDGAKNVGEARFS